jgi:zinc-ribbon domain
VQQDRYCRSCGQELQPEDRFCAGCGRPVHATAQVPTPEADVPVPPPQQFMASAQPSLATEQEGRSQRRDQAKWKIFFFLGCVCVSGLLLAVADPSTAGGRVALVIGYGIGASSKLLLYFIPIWLVLGGLVYVVARLLGKRLTYFRAVFDWWVTLVVVIPILLVGWPSP